MPMKFGGTPGDPSIPGGDLDQSANDIPAPAGPKNREIKDKEKSGYGHTGNREEVPVPEGAPKPHQIF
jgi:hypothetical protein